MRPIALPFIVAALVVPISAAFIFGGPAAGLAAGCLVAVAVAVIAIRMKPGGTIETVSAADSHSHVLVVISHELDQPEAIEEVKRALERDHRDASEVLLLAPAKSDILDLWATDVGRARAEAQRKLVVSVASLVTADITAEASVGDPNLVQAVEDQLRSFPATAVVLVTGPAGEDRDGERAAKELAARLEQPLTRVVVGEGAMMG